jgi:hypothetical protein
MQKQIAAWSLVIMMSAGLAAVGAPRAAASTKGRRNTTIVLGAATVGAALTHHKTAAIVLGAGTAAAYLRYRDAARRDRRRAARASRSAHVAGYRGRVVRSRYASRPVYHLVRRPVAPAKVINVPQPAAVPAAVADPAAPLAAAVPAPEPAPNSSSLPAGALALGAGAALSALGFAGRGLLKRRSAARLTRLSAQSSPPSASPQEITSTAGPRREPAGVNGAKG